MTRTVTPYPVGVAVGQQKKIQKKLEKMAVLAAAALLDELMGRNRNIAPNDKAKELNWEDPEVMCFCVLCCIADVVLLHVCKSIDVYVFLISSKQGWRF